MERRPPSRSSGPVRTAALRLVASFTGLLWLAGCTGQPGPTAPTPLPQELPPGLFLMDLVPASGLGLYTLPDGQGGMRGGLARIRGGTVELVTRDLLWPHNIEPWSDGYVVTDTNLPYVSVLDASGRRVTTIQRMAWRGGEPEPVTGTNWILPVTRAEVERFLGQTSSDLPHFLLCRERAAGEQGMWWAICTLDQGTLRSEWEMRAPGRKAHAALLHDGVLYGAASGARTLVVKDRNRQLEIPVGNIRYMELSAGHLWMAGDDFVGVYDRLPTAIGDKPRVFCRGIGRAQAVHLWSGEVLVTADGMLHVYGAAGGLRRTLGRPAPEPGQSWLHDRLRALGYIQ